MSRNIDEKYMRRCLQLARNGRQLSRPNPMVGAVIVAPDGEREEGRIIGEGYHVRCGEGHAEVNAFASVRPADEPLLPQSTVYVSLEPCAHHGKTPPCCDLIIKKRVRRVVVGCVDLFAQVQGRGIRRMREAGIEVTVGVLEEECRWLNRRFFTFHHFHRPYIILKWAQSADGFIDRNFQPTAISTPFTKMLSHRLRAEEDAILVGRVTAHRDGSQLNVRYWAGADPVRFVLSREMPIEQVLEACREQQLQSIIVEGGARTHRSFIEQDLWDEIRVETSPMAFGQGTQAPRLPQGLRLVHHLSADGNTICRYVREKQRADDEPYLLSQFNQVYRKE